MDTIGPGDLLGWSWMFPPYVWRFTARAVEPTDAIFFYGTILRQYCEKDHSLGYELFKRTRRLCSDACMLPGTGCSPSFRNSTLTKTSFNSETQLKQCFSSHEPMPQKEIEANQN